MFFPSQFSSFLFVLFWWFLVFSRNERRIFKQKIFFFPLSLSVVLFSARRQWQNKDSE